MAWHSSQLSEAGAWLMAFIIRNVLALALYRIAVFELPVILLKESIKILGLVRQKLGL